MALLSTLAAPPSEQSADAPAPSPSGAAASPDGRESHRQAALRASGVLVNRPQEALDALARTAATLCGVPIALLNFLDENVQTTAAATAGADRWVPTVLPRTDSVCQYAITAPRTFLEIPDLREDPRPGCVTVAGASGLRFYAGANIVSTGEQALGTMCILDTEPGALSPVQRAGLEDLAAVAAALIEQYGLAQRLVGVADRLGREADTDPLTGLYNRRALEPVLVNLPARTAVAMIDLDHFKHLNDSAGHEAGDRALCGYADLFRGELRDADVAARWGGEEFVLVLNDVADPREALSRLRGLAQDRLPVTFSAGLTVAGPAEDPRELLARVDRLMYRAKTGGRDQICDDLG